MIERDVAYLFSSFLARPDYSALAYAVRHVVNALCESGLPCPDHVRPSNAQDCADDASKFGVVVEWEVGSYSIEAAFFSHGRDFKLVARDVSDTISETIPLPDDQFVEKVHKFFQDRSK